MLHHSSRDQRAGTRRICRGALAALAAFTMMSPLAPVAVAQDPSYDGQYDPSGRPAASTRPRRDDAYRPPEGANGPDGGFGQQAGSDGRPWDGSSNGGNYGSGYGGAGGGNSGGTSDDPRYRQPQQQPQPQREYGSGPSGGYGSAPPSGYGGPPSGGYGDPRYSSQQQPDNWRGGGDAGRDQVYRPPSGPTYGDDRGSGNQYGGYRAPGDGGYGAPYSPQGPDNERAYSDNGAGYGEPRGGTYSQNEVVDTGHRFFGSISQGLARAIEKIFSSQGRPNGYILGEDAGGAIVAGLRYGEGMLYTKDVGNHRVYWQGPSLGYDFGGEGSKTMVLVYNLRDPADIYDRFGGVQGAAYVIGGVSVQFQTNDHVTLAVIRSGVGLRLGANVGYLKYTRRPTWNPF